MGTFAQVAKWPGGIVRANRVPLTLSGWTETPPPHRERAVFIIEPTGASP